MRDISYGVGDKGKLSPRFIGLYKVLEHVGLVAYCLALPPDLSRIHNVFIYFDVEEISIRFESYYTLEVEQNISYEEEPVQILDEEVLWQNHKVEEATWERESSMREQYPYFSAGELLFKWRDEGRDSCCMLKRKLKAAAGGEKASHRVSYK
ncbi:Transposon Ty3-I Gag-Pol polyprotein [Gossypium australe]|uniref:Transposon Ty3-I Gag-Pol polyprotein n=1 Tax=Gossypium australe TaxID=47621 RepID=A0A5B6UZX2_9ROSI|nr:Transposon Ty3-I Gag-Pol polyprotein [Gossypium australe]